MKNLFFLLAVLLAPVLANAQGILYENIALGNSAGTAKVLAGATVRVCTAGDATVPCTPVTIYSDVALATVKANPFSTDQNGNYSFYSAPGVKYKIQISSPNFTTVTHDYVLVAVAELAETCLASDQVGATAGAKWLACYNALPSTGGTIGMNLSGAQTIATDVFVAATAKNVHTVWPEGQYSFTLSTTFPANITNELKAGAQWTAPTGVTVTVKGPFLGTKSKHFTLTGTGKVQFTGQTTSINSNFSNPELDVAWWGYDCTTNTSANDTAIQAVADSLVNGGVIKGLAGDCLSNFPTLTNQGDWIIFKGHGRWRLKTPITTIPRLAFIGEGSASTALRQVAAYWAITSDNSGSYSAWTTPLVKHNNAGPLYISHVAFTHSTSNPNAPTFQCVNGSSVNVDNAMFTNDNSTNAASDAVEIDGCFWLWFNQVNTSTGASAAGAVNYDLVMTGASTQATGLVFISNSQMNGSGLRFAGTRSMSGFGNTTVTNSTLESAVVSGVIFDRTNNVSPDLIKFDGFTNADATAGTVAIECTGTRTLAANDPIRGIRIVHDEGFTLACAGEQVEITMDNGPVFTGNFSPGTDQRRWALTNFGALDQRWLYSGGTFAPSWTPFAAPQAVPNQDPTTWAAYTNTTGETPTITTGVKAPDGSMTAARMECATTTCGKYVDQSITFATGDWIVWGGWTRSNDSTKAVTQEVYWWQAVSGCVETTHDSGLTAYSSGEMSSINERRRAGNTIGWYPITNIAKVTNAVSNPCTIRFRMEQNNTQPTERWKPFFMVIPASAGVPDGDVVRAWRAGAFNNIYTGAGANNVVGNPEAKHVFANINNILFVDGVKYAQTAAGINAAIAAATTDQIVEVPPVLSTLALGATTITVDKRIHLKLGTNQYTSTADPAISISVDGARVSGAGMLSTKISNSTSTANTLKVGQGVDDVIVEDLWLDAAGKTIDEANFHQGNCLLAGEGGGSDAASTAILRLTVQRIYCTDGNNGVVLRYAQDSAVLDSVFNFSHAALAQVLVINGSKNRVSNNAFRDSGGTTNAVYVRGLNAAADVEPVGIVVSNNTIQGTYAFEGINTSGQYGSIVGNTIGVTSAGANSAGIAVFMPATAAVAHTASQAHHNTVSGNTILIAGTGGAGVYGIATVDNGSTGPYGANDNVITNNTVTVAGGHGIAALASCVRNAVSNNRIQITSGTSKDGILSEGVDTIITGNFVSGATGNGISLAQTAGYGDRAVIAQNIVTGSAGDNIVIGANAGDNATVVGNSSTAATGRGISVSASSGTGIVVVGNNSFSNGAADILPTVANSGNGINGLISLLNVSSYNGIATVSNGVPAEYATVDLTGQGAAISATTIYAVPASGAGQYRVCFNAKVTQAATTSSVLGGTNGFQLVYTDQDDSVVTTTVAGHPFNSTTANLALNTDQALYNGCLFVNAKASTNIQYQIDYTSVGATPMQFNLHVILEKL